MKIWVDDLRPPPDNTWNWAKTSQEALDLLEFLTTEGACWIPFQEMSLDHDLGGDDTTRPIVLWMCENGIWPEEVYVHSMNSVGREWLEGMIARYKP